MGLSCMLMVGLSWGLSGCGPSAQRFQGRWTLEDADQSNLSQRRRQRESLGEVMFLGQSQMLWIEAPQPGIARRWARSGRYKVESRDRLSFELAESQQRVKGVGRLVGSDRLQIELEWATSSGRSPTPSLLERVVSFVVETVEQVRRGKGDREPGLQLQRQSRQVQLPTDLRILPLPENRQDAPETQGRWLIVQALRQQEKFYAENRYFWASKFDRNRPSRFQNPRMEGQVLTGTQSEYRVEQVSVSFDGQQVTLTAQALQPEAKSYAATLFVTPEGKADAVICETQQPSATPPYIAGFPVPSWAEFQCPGGSVKF